MISYNTDLLWSFSEAFTEYIAKDWPWTQHCDGQLSTAALIKSLITQAVKVALKHHNGTSSYNKRETHEYRVV